MCTAGCSACIGYLFVFFAYFAVLIGIAVARSRQIREMSDFVLGNRRMGAFTSALSAGSSGASAGTMLVVPALVFMAWHDLELWIIDKPGPLFLAHLEGAGHKAAPLYHRCRRVAHPAGVPGKTLWRQRRALLRTLAGGITIFFVIFYVSSGLIAGAKLLETIFGLGETAGIVITLVAVASYTFIGGFVAVSRTDVFQALIMLAGFIILPLTLILGNG